MDHSSTKKILIVDDERKSRFILKHYLLDSGYDIDVIEAENGPDAIEKINHSEPDIVFLDIEMPGMSGFDVPFPFPERKFLLIFQTAFEEYAVRAFDEEAIDYLLKPLSPDRVKTCLERIDRLTNNYANEVGENLFNNNISLRKISVKIGNRQKLIPTNDILYFKSVDRINYIFTSSEKIMYSLTLNHLEKSLNAEQFYRIHRSAIVNINGITSIKKINRKFILKMENDEEITISRERYAELKNKISSKIIKG